MQICFRHICEEEGGLLILLCYLVGSPCLVFLKRLGSVV